MCATEDRPAVHRARRDGEAPGAENGAEKHVDVGDAAAAHDGVDVDARVLTSW
ncbi:hypothetical protein AAFP35_02160 [Gordonia sp. CPCC 206044]|uniref:hypothetical protein n=1 Tax=Gordonia sp. CPCC 206044 TaxID=3140793 RepID=UPI003AF3C14D